MISICVVRLKFNNGFVQLTCSLRLTSNVHLNAFSQYLLYDFLHIPIFTFCCLHTIRMQNLSQLYCGLLQYRLYTLRHLPPSHYWPNYGPLCAVLLWFGLWCYQWYKSVSWLLTDALGDELPSAPPLVIKKQYLVWYFGIYPSTYPSKVKLLAVFLFGWICTAFRDVSRPRGVPPTAHQYNLAKTEPYQD